MKIFAVLLFSIALTRLSPAEDFQGSSQRVEYEIEPIKYNEQTPTDAVSQLQHRLATGETALKFDPQFGYLPAVLDALKVPRSSQSLVFSKTSLQRSFITPGNPRALYLMTMFMSPTFPARHPWKSPTPIRISGESSTGSTTTRWRVRVSCGTRIA